MRVLAVLAWSALLAIYLAGRFWLFAGPGGYQDEDGRRFALLFDLPLFLRNALGQLPYRLLLPIKDLAEREPTIVSWLTVAAAGLLAVAMVGVRRPVPADLGLPLLWLAALLPTASVLSVDAHLGGGRLVYLPLALLLAALAARIGPWTRGRVAAGGALLLAWTGLAHHQAGDWTFAADHFQRTLAALEDRQPKLESGSVLLIAGPELHRGVLMWRNVGYTLFTSNLRRDVRFLIGSAAELDDVSSLGGSLRELVVDEQARPYEATACERALLTAPVGPSREISPAAAGPTIGLPPAGPIHGIRVRGDRPPRTLAGRLWWRRPGLRFVGERSRLFRYRLDGTATIRLQEPAPGPLIVRIDMADASAYPLLRMVEALVDLPACRALPAWPAAATTP